LDIFDTRLTVAVPTHQAESLRATLQGGNGWPYAVADDPEDDPLRSASAHARVAARHAVEHQTAALQAQLRAAHPQHPAWMPLCKTYALAWAHAPHRSLLDNATVGLSFPKLLPLRQEDWMSCFPGDTDALGWWTPAAGTTPYQEESPHGWFAATRNRLGTALIPWGQEEETLGTVEHDGTETTVFVFQWRAFTPTITGFADALSPLLAKHRASALLVGVGPTVRYEEPVSVVYWPHTSGPPIGYTTQRQTAEPETTAFQAIWNTLLRDPLHHFHNGLFPS
jgi:hypothetical protein